MPERRVPGKKLVNQNAQGPPVHGGGVTLVMDNLGGQVLWGSAQGVRLLGSAVVAVPPAAEPLREAEIDELDVALAVQQQVLGLEVAVGHAVLGLVQVLEHQDDLGGVEAGHVLVEASVLAQVRKELAAGHVVEHNVEEVVVGEGGEHVCYKREPRHVGEDGALVAHMIDLLELDHLGLAQYLERKDLVALRFVLRVRWSDKADSGKRSCDAVGSMLVGWEREREGGETTLCLHVALV